MEWLTACLDEIERVANAAIADGRGPEPDVWFTEPEPNDLIVHVADEDRVFGFGTAPHIARHDPRGVLARVEAERAIVELHHRDHECSVYDHHGEVDNCAWVFMEPCSTLRVLAYGHRHDAPGYDPAWAPKESVQ